MPVWREQVTFDETTMIVLFTIFFYYASLLKIWSTDMTRKVIRKSLQLLDIFFHKVGRTDVLFPPLWRPIFFSS